MSSLDAVGVLPWHLKLSVQLFDAKGNAHDQGTIEEWWSSPGTRRIVYAMPSYSMTSVRNEGKLFVTKGAESVPMMLEVLLGQVVHPMPDFKEVSAARLDFSRRKVDHIALDCIMLDQKVAMSVAPPLGLFPTYCLDGEKDSLREFFEFASLAILRNRIGTFQTRLVSTDIRISSLGVLAASAQVTKLETFSPSIADHTPTPDLEVAAEATPIDANLLVGKIVKKVQPVYPEIAKQRHARGTVLLHVIITRQGRIESLRLLSAPDPDLAIAAMAAVRQWTYLPTLLNGLSTEVDSVITVNFDFR